ncbi:hypothetical protein JCM10207_007084 [Rhodosporidiobolus poonsookiae]
MHKFWTPSFEPLQALLVEQLGQDGVHSLLPLLGVNKHLRSLAVRSMLKAYRDVKFEPVKVGSGLDADVYPLVKEGEYILVTPNGVSPYDGPMRENDPRCSFADRMKKTSLRANGALFLTSYDAKTSTCTFKPNREFSMISLSLFCDEQHHSMREGCESYDTIPTTWFRKAAPGATCSLFGLELAARPDRHPPVDEYVLHASTPPMPKSVASATFDPASFLDLDGYEEVKVEDEKMRCGWTVSYTFARIDDLATPAGFDLDYIHVPASLTIEKLKVPLIDLFAPHGATKKPGFYES